MKIFVDTANLDEIKAALDTGFVEGVTTNPSLLAKEPKGKFEEHIGKIVELLVAHTSSGNLLVEKNNLKHLSVEVFSKNPEEILAQAERFQNLFNYPALSIKVQVGWSELGVIRRLNQKNISVNCTACMTVSQAAWAAKAGAKYASLFWGRIRDSSDDAITRKLNALQAFGKGDTSEYALLSVHRIEAKRLNGSNILTEEDADPISVMSRTRAIFEREKFDCEIIAGSIRTIWDVRDALLAGAHIVTVPYKFFSDFPQMTQHFKTDEVINQFLTDFESWLK